jgi:uncharacterized membrane protein YhaH (DUF805 family)
MKPQTLLFSPNGRIGPRSFWRGVILLVGVQVVMQVVSALVPQNLALPFSLLSFVYLVALFWGYLCVYAKRFHDADMGAVWFLASAIGGLLLSVLVTMIAFPLLFPDVWAAIQDAVSASGESEARAAAERMAYAMQARANGLIAWNLVNLAIVNGVVGWLVARLPSMRGTNRFGPPEGGDLSVF